MASKPIIRLVGDCPLPPMASECCSRAAKTFHCPRVDMKVADRYREVAAKWSTQVLWAESRKSFCSKDKPQVGRTYPEVSNSPCLRMAEMCVCMPTHRTHSAFLLSGVIIRGQCDSLLWLSVFFLASRHYLTCLNPSCKLRAYKFPWNIGLCTNMYLTRHPRSRPEMVWWGQAFHCHIDKRAWSFQQLRGRVGALKISFKNFLHAPSHIENGLSLELNWAWWRVLVVHSVCVSYHACNTSLCPYVEDIYFFSSYKPRCARKLSHAIKKINKSHLSLEIPGYFFFLREIPGYLVDIINSRLLTLHLKLSFFSNDSVKMSLSPSPYSSSFPGVSG